MATWRSLICCLLLIFPSAAFSQTTTGTIGGSVRDSSGGILPNVTVNVSNVQTGVAYPARTNAEGLYVAPLLPPGDYVVSVEMPGFRKYVESGLKLDVQQNRTVDINLSPGDVTSTVEVQATTTPLATSSSTFSNVIENKRILDLPLNGRDAFRLALLTPGVFDGQGSTPWIGGGRNGTSEISIDGSSVIVPQTGSVNEAAFTPQVDAVQEFAVMTNALSAEYGRTGGGVINVVTKSGTNSLHGSAYDFLRNSKLDANGFFRNRNLNPRSPFQRNQFGFTLGGPVVLPRLYNGRNRTFFFLDYEGTRARQASSNTYSVPLESWKRGDFSNLRFTNGQRINIYDPLTTRQDAAGNYTRQPFAGNIIPTSRLNLVGRNIASYFPAPNATPTNAFTQANNYFASGKSVNDADRSDVRIDHNLSSRWRMFGRYSQGRNDGAPFNPFLNAAGPVGGPTNIDRYSVSIDQTITLNPSTLLDIRYGFNRVINDGSPSGRGFDIGTLGFPSSLVDLARSQSLEFPTTQIAGLSQLGSGSSWASYYPQNSHILSGAYSKVQSTHTFKAGIEYRKLLFNQYLFALPSGSYNADSKWTQRDAARASTTEGYGLASLLLGYPTSGQITHDVAVASASSYAGLYFQDDWRVNDRLTLNLGVRYEVDTPRTERYDRQSWFDITAPSPINGRVSAFPNLRGAMRFAGPDGRVQTPTDLNNIGPRFGFAFRPTSKLVMRGGYGFMYGPSVMQAAGNQSITGRDGFSSATNMVVSLDDRIPIASLSNPFPDGFNLPRGAVEGPNSGANTQLGLNPGNGYFIDYRNPAIQQWNFNLQQQVGSQLVIEAGYIGSKGQHLMDSENMAVNQLPSSYFSLGNSLNDLVPNPFFGVITNSSSALSRATVQRSQLLRPYPQYQALGAIRKPQGNSLYHAFTLKVEKRYSSGLGLLVSYTGGKLIDDTSTTVNFLGPGGNKQDYYNRQAERAVSVQEVSSRFVASFNYDLPFGRKRKLFSSMPAALDYVLGGWQVNGIVTLQTGTPLVITQNQNNTGLGSSSQRPNNNGTSAYLGSDGRTLDQQITQWFNTDVFSIAPAFTFGNVGRTLPNVRRPGTRNIDFSFFKNLRFNEDRFTVQFRAEAFNAFNTTQLGEPGTVVGTANFGTIGSTAINPRQVQVAVKVIF